MAKPDMLSQPEDRGIVPMQDEEREIMRQSLRALEAQLAKQSEEILRLSDLLLETERRFDAERAYQIDRLRRISQEKDRLLNELGEMKRAGE
ncbi:hypothetical protein Q4543_15220 [Salipiger sp. 1_MG-2023]|uniref:hypothetical protein n=1 Tax=Salipiger sp. 1_MG-2023 TaxID=3062665 RepID=UPI0026E177A0|nr:hypothetical protein [Salipiger sp. 1_MG-2023]MDO6586863.1 hypothetical protein [Salipiger sp. 1_MG-2023]